MSAPLQDGTGPAAPAGLVAAPVTPAETAAATATPTMSLRMTVILPEVV
jgi:hypothetical protein